ncbi:hypothetical protein C5S32_10145 [ANME-1 cluster archaeon GoMg1]|nr:hypothetical protein [ANME-1 cluster archaeon GoMg1]
MDSEEEAFDKIINAIPSMGETGATIDELSKITHLERHTLSKYLSRLRAEGRISYKQIGRAKVWFVSKAPLQHIFRLREEDQTYTEKIFSRILADIPEGVLVLDFDYNIMFMNRYLLALYGDCVGQKYYPAIFGTGIGMGMGMGMGKSFEAHQNQIRGVIEGSLEEIESQVEDKGGRILEIKAREVENPDGSFSIIAIIRDISEKVGREERIKNLSELHRLLGESVNRSYTIDQLCSTILENLRNVIGYDMGDILIYNPENNLLSSFAQIGYPHMEDRRKRNTVDEWERGIARAAIIGKEPLFFVKGEKREGMRDELSYYNYASELAAEYNLQEIYAIPLRTKGEPHGALLILTRHGRVLSEEDRSLLGGISEGIASGIAKIKVEEELRVKANAVEISINSVLMADTEGKLTYVNPAFLKMWGYDREKEVLGRSCTEFWKQMDETGAKDILIAVQEKGDWEGELIGVRKDGSEFKLRLSASLIIGKKGPLQFVAAAAVAE